MHYTCAHLGMQALKPKNCIHVSLSMDSGIQAKNDAQSIRFLSALPPVKATFSIGAPDLIQIV